MHSASTDLAVVRRMWARQPKANIGGATGTPWASVLDVGDTSSAREEVARMHALDGPVAATARGLHFPMRGIDVGAISLGYGELRGRAFPSGERTLAQPGVPARFGEQWSW